MRGLPFINWTVIEIKSTFYYLDKFLDVKPGYENNDFKALN